MSSPEANLDHDGFKRFPSALAAIEVERLSALFGDDDRPGIRLGAADLATVKDLLTQDGPVARVARACIGMPAFAVRAIIFDKMAGMNWSLDWHQDRTIAVAAKADVDGFGPWTVKQGLIHVQPPQAVIEAMVTLRIHLDDVPIDNAPLRIILGSHRLGRIPEDQLSGVVDRGKAIPCLAQSGDIWAYKTAIVHASSASSGSQRRRRVLQLDYAKEQLPKPLEWAMRL